MKCELCGVWLDMHSPSCPLSEPQDLSSINQPTITALRQTVLELREQLRKREEEEAAACPEDVGFPEWCRALVKQLDRALSELADARKDTERLDWLETERIREQEYLDGKRQWTGPALFRQNMLITRNIIDAARAATDTSLKDKR